MGRKCRELCSGVRSCVLDPQCPLSCAVRVGLLLAPRLQEGDDAIHVRDVSAYFQAVLLVRDGHAV